MVLGAEPQQFGFRKGPKCQLRLRCRELHDLVRMAEGATHSLTRLQPKAEMSGLISQGKRLWPKLGRLRQAPAQS